MVTCCRCLEVWQVDKRHACEAWPKLIILPTTTPVLCTAYSSTTSQIWPSDLPIGAPSRLAMHYSSYFNLFFKEYFTHRSSRRSNDSDTRVYRHWRSPTCWEAIRPYHSHEAVLVCALCPLLTIDSFHLSSCPPRRCHPQPHLPPTLDFKRSSKLRSNHTKSRQRKTFSHIRSPLKYNLASQLLPYLLSFKIGFENSRQTAMVMSD